MGQGRAAFEEMMFAGNSLDKAQRVFDRFHSQIEYQREDLIRTFVGQARGS